MASSSETTFALKSLIYQGHQLISNDLTEKKVRSHSSHSQLFLLSCSSLSLCFNRGGFGTNKDHWGISRREYTTPLGEILSETRTKETRP